MHRPRFNTKPGTSRRSPMPRASSLRGGVPYPAWQVRYVMGARPHVAAATWGTMGSLMRGAARLMKKFGVIGNMRITVTGREKRCGSEIVIKKNIVALLACDSWKNQVLCLR
jgi:hypothetical protein